MDDDFPNSRESRRFRRQMDSLLRRTPRLRAFAQSLIHGRLRYLRIPIALLLILGGFVGFLPVLGFWMIPLGLLLLAIDIPALRPVVSAAIVRLRRWVRRALGPNGRFSRIGAWLGRHE